jgi:threonine-phosphate decarboxylase
LRVGAVVSSVENIGQWKQTREPWQVNVLAEEAALAALADDDHAARSFEFVQVERQWLMTELRNLPRTDPSDSDANFVYIRVPYPAQRLYEHLLRRKILIRDCAGWPGITGEAVRVAVRTRAENEKLVAAWSEF